MHYEVAPPVDSPQAWDDLKAWLPRMLEELRNSEVYNWERRPPDDQRGIYYFSDHGRALYVARTAITARSRRAGGAPSTSFRSRFDQHTQEGRPPGSAPFAVRLAIDEAVQRGIPVPGGRWWDDRHGHPDFLALFTAAKLRIFERMEMRIVTFNDDERCPLGDR